MRPTRLSPYRFTVPHLLIVLVLLLSLLPAPTTVLHAVALFADSGVRFIPSNTGVKAWGDYDNDGDLDIVISGIVDIGNNVTDKFIKLYINDAGRFIDSGVVLPAIGYGTAQWGDYDNDGDLDLLLVGLSNEGYLLRVYKNLGGTLVDSGAKLDGMEDASAAWGDYDNDGDLDFVVSGWAYGGFITKLYRNDAGAFIDSKIALPGVVQGSLAWGDYDVDGDQDLFIMGFGGDTTLITRIYRNDFGTLVDSQAELPTLMNGSGDWGDYDNDGDLDLLLTGDRLYEWVSRVYRNDGGHFVNANVGLPNLVYGISYGKWFDYDNDGDLDIHLTQSADINRLFENDGGTFTSVTVGFPPYALTGPLWGDYDRDGRLDPIFSDDSSARLYHNNSPRANTPPGEPIELTDTTEGTNVRLHWEQATDAQTPANGLTYNLRVGTAPGKGDVVAPMALANGMRKVVQMGNTGTSRSWTLTGLLPNHPYYWSVQAVDSAYAGSAFSTEQSFVTGDTSGRPLPPENEYAVSINAGALYTQQPTVTLTVNARPGTVQMQISNDGGFGGAIWEPYSHQKIWQITRYWNYVIPRIVYARFKDSTGTVWGTYQDDILLDETPPQGQGHVREASNSTIIDLTATDDVSGVGAMRFAPTQSFTGASWEPYATNKVWDFGANPTVYIQFRDQAGNVSPSYMIQYWQTLLPLVLQS